MTLFFLSPTPIYPPIWSFSLWLTPGSKQSFCRSSESLLFLYAQESLSSGCGSHHFRSQRAPFLSAVFLSPCFLRKEAWVRPLLARGPIWRRPPSVAHVPLEQSQHGWPVMLTSDQQARGARDLQRPLCGCEGPLSPVEFFAPSVSRRT